MWQSFVFSVLHASFWYAALMLQLQLQFIKTLFYNSRGAAIISKLHTNCSVRLLLAGQLPIRRRQQFALPSPPPPRVLQASPSCDSGAFCLHPPQDPVHSLPVDVGGEVPVPLRLDHFSHCFPHTLCPFFGRDCCPFSLWKTTLAALPTLCLAQWRSFYWVDWVSDRIHHLLLHQRMCLDTDTAGMLRGAVRQCSQPEAGARRSLLLLSGAAAHLLTCR